MSKKTLNRRKSYKKKRGKYKINGNEIGKIRMRKSFHGNKTAIYYIDAHKSEI